MHPKADNYGSQINLPHSPEVRAEVLSTLCPSLKNTEINGQVNCKDDDDDDDKKRNC